MKNGIIYSVIKLTIEVFKYLSLVELFKYVSIKVISRNGDLDSKILASRLGVDTFIILKWTFVLVAINWSINHPFITVLVWYLIFSNLHTYFYYHIWAREALNTENFDIERIRRRFITLMLSIGFSNLCFTYLIRHPYQSDFQWSDNTPMNIKATWFSFANSLTAEYEFVKPITKNGVELTVIQLIISFIFLTMILGKSIPQTKSTV